MQALLDSYWFRILGALLTIGAYFIYLPWKAAWDDLPKWKLPKCFDRWVEKEDE